MMRGTFAKTISIKNFMGLEAPNAFLPNIPKAAWDQKAWARRGEQMSISDLPR